MKKRNFKIKKIESGYGIFLRNHPERPLATYPTRKAAGSRLSQYIKNVNLAN
jgi:hypothetical protein